MPAQLLLIPGLMCNARIFAAQSGRFAGVQVIDGFGQTDSLVEMARIALAAAPGRISLLGHSMGARVALEVYRLAPARVERLALVSTGVHNIRPGEADKRRALVDLGRSQGAAALVEAWLPPMIAPSRRDHDAFVAPLRHMSIAVGVEAFASQVEALLDRPEVESLLPGITCPTLVAVGSADEWSPPDQHVAIAATIPNARLTVIDGAGHMLPAEAPDALNIAIADWLSLSTRH